MVNGCQWCCAVLAYTVGNFEPKMCKCNGYFSPKIRFLTEFDDFSKLECAEGSIALLSHNTLK